MCQPFVLAQSAKKTSNDHFIDPFGKIYDSRIAVTIRNYELLPIIDDEEIIKLDVSTKNDALSQAKTLAIPNSYNFYNGHTIGNHTTELRGPAKINNKNVYFWIVKGYIKHYLKYEKGPVGNTITTRLKTPITEPYIIVFYYYRDFTKELKTAVSLLSINNREYQFSSNTHNDVNKFTNSLRETKTKELYEKAISKTTWAYSNREEYGTIAGYKNRRLKINLPEKGTKYLDVSKLSNEDKVILKAYLDYKEIPIEEPK